MTLGPSPARRAASIARTAVSSILLVLVAALPALPPSAAAADEDAPPPTTARRDAQAHEITVTATRLETPRKEVAGAITVITAADLARTRKTSLVEALQAVAGTSVVQNGGAGAAASLSLRGANAEHTLVLIDGVEVNDPINPSRSFDLAHLSLADVDRIEILRGPQGPLYGSDALGGVVNVITRTGDGPARVAVAASGGSFGTWTGAVNVSGSSGRRRYAVGVSALTSSGISAASARRPGNLEPDGYRNLTVSARGGLPLSKSFDLDLALRGVAARTDIDAFGGDYGDDVNSRQDYESLFFRGTIRGSLAGNRWEPRLTVSAVTGRRTLDNPADPAHPTDSESGSYRSRLLRADWQNNLFLHPSHTVTFGLEAEGERGDSRYSSRSAWGDYASDFPNRSTGTLAAYVQEQARIGGRLFVTTGLRVDHHSRAGTILTWRAAPAYVIASTGTRLRATVGTGFKSPSLYQLYAPGTAWGPIGNAALAPERSIGWDAGVEQEVAGRRLVVGAGIFRNDFRNLIDFDTARGYVNVNRARTRGTEWTLESEPFDGSRLALTYTRMDATDRATGLRLVRRPRDKFTAEGSVPVTGTVRVSMSVAAIGAREDRDFAAFPARTVVLPAYALVDGVVAWRAAAGLEVFLRLDNALDARYETVFGYGTPGRSLALGIRLDR